MNCAAFEHGLARLMGDESSGSDHAQLLDALRRHAADCRECGGSADLLDLLAQPSGDREFVSDPGKEYWASFEGRLRPRLEKAPKRSRGPWWAVAAAVLLLSLLAGWMLRGPGEVETPSVIADSGTGPTGAVSATVELPPALVESLDQASAEEVENQLAALEELGPSFGTGWEESADTYEALRDGGLFPEVERLDAGTRERLLNWLRDQNRDLEGAQG